MNNPRRSNSFHIVSKNQNWPRKITSWLAWGDLQVCLLLWRRRCSKSKVHKASLVFCRTPGACPLENGYARPVEGIHVLVDMRQMKLKSWTNHYAIFAESLLPLNIFSVHSIINLSSLQSKYL
jgi:hypothetical protein